MKFKADQIFADYDENDVLIIGFSSGDKKYFMIQHTDEYDDQDKELGMDTYYIEKNDQGFGMYGGIEKIALNRNEIVFELDEEAKEHLCEEFIEICFDCDEDTFSNLKLRLQQIFRRIDLKTE